MKPAFQIAEPARIIANLLLVVLLLMACPRPGHAQMTAAIIGRVADASGGVVGDATVTVRNLETGATRVVTTDGAGSFRIS
jgi:uncharacterized membrane protein